MSHLESIFALQCRELGLPKHEREYRFSPPRRWRFDFAWLDQKLAVEIEGGIFSHGRHTRGKGFQADCEKYNTAVEQGWTVLRYTRCMVENWEGAHQVERILCST